MSDPVTNLADYYRTADELLATPVWRLAVSPRDADDHVLEALARPA
jgi:hypothetical protein